MTRFILSANTDWYLYNFRLSLLESLRQEGAELLLVSPAGPYGEKLRELGFNWQPIHISRRGMNPILEISTLIDYIKLYRREKPQLVHHFTLKPVLYGSLAAKMTKTNAVVNAVTGLGYLFMNRNWSIVWLQRLLSLIFRYALALDKHRVIFQHPGDKEFFLSRGLVSPDVVTIIPGSGVDEARFSPQPEPPGTPVILMASRMLWDKGVQELVEAARLLTSAQVQARVVLVGRSDPGNPSAIPEHRLRAWEEEGLIEWWGHREDMPAVYRQSHIIVLPSYHEGVPKNLIEAAAMAKPIVATDIPGCRQVVTHEVNGLLVPVQDSNALAEALTRLIEAPELRRRMGERGREIVLQKFTADTVNKQTIQVYKDLLGSSVISSSLQK